MSSSDGIEAPTWSRVCGGFEVVLVGRLSAVSAEAARDRILSALGIAGIDPADWSADVSRVATTASSAIDQGHLRLDDASVHGRPKGCAKYPRLTPRAWAKVRKNTTRFEDARFTIFGRVQQFDRATGPENFMAHVGTRRAKPGEEFFDNSDSVLVVGDEDGLKDVVEGDLFKAKVVVRGYFKYRTVMGAKFTIPWLGLKGYKHYGYEP